MRKKLDIPIKLNHKELILLMSYCQRWDSTENGQMLYDILAVILEPILPQLKPARLLCLTSENPVLLSSRGPIYND